MSVVIALLGVLVAGLGWVVAFPIGGAPDESFHLGSMWCPRPVTESCETKVINGELRIAVPEPVMYADSPECYATHPEKSAACSVQYSEGRVGYSYRYDDGAYPKGYYRFNHLLVGDDVGTTVLLVRSVNLLLAVGLLGVIAFLMPQRYRRAYMFAMLVSWIPVGWHLINSVNPSSWAITGTFVFAAAFFASLEGFGRRRWLALLVASVGALMCISSRGDSAFYLFVVSLALLFAVKRVNWTPVHLAFGAAWSVIGVYFMFASGQSSIVVASTPDPAQEGPLSVAFRSFLQIPQFAAGFYGHWRGLGSFDTNVDGTPAILSLIVAGAVLFVSLRGSTVRTWLSVTVVSGALFGIPLLTTVMGLQWDMWNYQPRYVLPLLAVAFFLLFAVRMSPIFEGPEMYAIGVCLAIAHCLALKRVLWRYVSGATGQEPLVDLDKKIQWWWDLPLSPTGVWVLTSVAGAVAIAAIIFLVRSRPAVVPERCTDVSADIPAPVVPVAEAAGPSAD